MGLGALPLRSRCVRGIAVGQRPLGPRMTELDVRASPGSYRCGVNHVEQVPRLLPDVTVTLTFTR